jgi:hypothetical protein
MANAKLAKVRNGFTNPPKIRKAGDKPAKSPARAKDLLAERKLRPLEEKEPQELAPVEKPATAKSRNSNPRITRTAKVPPQPARLGAKMVLTESKNRLDLFPG